MRAALCYAGAAAAAATYAGTPPPLNCTAVGEALCLADANCTAFGVYRDQIQLHGCATATVANHDWALFTRAGASLPGVNINETLCEQHPVTGMQHSCAPPPPPPGPPLYEKLGAIEVGTFENTLVYWHGQLLVLENIACSFRGHAGEYWPEVYGNHSYARLRDFKTGLVLSNVSSTVAFGFVSAFADYTTDTLWLFGTPSDRCSGNGHATTVQAWWTMDPALQAWSTAQAFDLGKVTYNVEVTAIGPRGGSSAAERADWAARRARAPPAFPGARYAMFLEAFTWAVNNATDGNLTRGWELVESKPPPGGAAGGPSMTYSADDDLFYILTGGHVVQLFRTRDFSTWEESNPSPFIAPSAGDALVSPFNGFAATAAKRARPRRRTWASPSRTRSCHLTRCGSPTGRRGQRTPMTRTFAASTWT